MPPDDEVVMIFNGHCEFDMPASDWRRILWIAQCYGWQPHGTEPPDELAITTGIWRGKPTDWTGAYSPSDGQEITEDDAKALAAALERALPDVPDCDTDEKRRREVDAGSTWFVDVPASGANCLGAFKGIRKKILTAFIAHCREDGSVWLY